MKYAVIRTGGKQYRVSEGDIIEVEHLDIEPNSSVTFDQVLFQTADNAYEIGTPLISGLTVQGSVVEHFKGEKIRVGKFKSKVRHRRVMGHRQHLSRVKIETIGGKVTKSAEKKTDEVKKPKTVKKVA